MNAAQNGPGPEGHEGLDASIKRACDQCRTRKCPDPRARVFSDLTRDIALLQIRCDKESPCSNCRIAQRACSSTGIGQKPKETRQRVLISTQYERKIDQIEDRLGSIERLLQKLTAEPERGSGVHWPSRAPSHHDATSSRGFTGTPSSSSAAGTPGGVPAHEARNGGAGGNDDSTFEGNSSLSAHTAFASEFLEHAVERTPLLDLSPNMSGALATLKQMVSMHNAGTTSQELRFPNQKPMPKGGLRELPMPPMEMVVEMLRAAREDSPTTFTLMLCFVALDDFTEHCRRVYFAAEDYPPAIFIIVIVGLFYMFQEKIGTASNDDRLDEYKRYSDLCRVNLETALAHLNLLFPATKENIEALLIGASWAVEISKPSLAWQLNIMASQLCQTLGYHRASTFRDLSPEARDKDNRPILFWLAYMLDRGLALRLGRSPTIPDYDITVPREIRHSAITPEWQEILGMWVKHAEVQGNIYEKLYSPRALGEPVEKRVEAARGLVQEIKVMSTSAHLMRTRLPQRKGLAPDFNSTTLDMLVKSDEVSLLSSLTMVYRAIPPPPGARSTFNMECVESAREAIQMHLYCMDLLVTSEYLTEAYLHWTILYAPFTPFIVLFCHVIETSNADDVRRLSGFLGSLQSTSAVSEAVAKLHGICQILYNVAVLYVDAKAKSQEDQAMFPIGNEVDMYLSALGFANAPTDEAMAGAGLQNMTPGVAGEMAQAAQLGDWYSGNRYMMGLLEEDLSQFGQMNWSGP